MSMIKVMYKVMFKVMYKINDPPVVEFRKLNRGLVNSQPAGENSIRNKEDHNEKKLRNCMGGWTPQPPPPPTLIRSLGYHAMNAGCNENT